MPTPAGWVPGEIAVYFKRHTSGERIETIISTFGLSIAWSSDDPDGMYEIDVPIGDEEKWIAEFRALPETDSAHPSRYIAPQRKSAP